MLIAVFSIADINRSNTKTNHILKLGQNKTLDCSIDGGPMIKHTWYKGKKKLAESRRLLIHVDKKDKFGNYTCVGKNRAGQEIILFSLKEQRKLFVFLSFRTMCSYFVGCNGRPFFEDDNLVITSIVYML